MLGSLCIKTALRSDKSVYKSGHKTDLIHNQDAKLIIFSFNRKDWEQKLNQSAVNGVIMSKTHYKQSKYFLIL